MPRRTLPSTGIRLHGRTYRLNLRIDGARQFINLETDDYAEAVRRAAAIRANPQLVSSADLMAEIDRFIAYKRRMKKYTESTARSKRAKLKLMADFLPKGSTAASVTTKELQQWHDDLLTRVAATSLIGMMMSARSFFRWAVEIERLVRRSPLEGVEIIDEPGRARKDFCEYELRDQLIASAPTDELRLILLMGFHAGMRFQEIVEARPFWFDIPRKQINLRKTATIQFKDREERSIPMTLEFQRFLKAYGLSEPFVIAPAATKGKWVYRYDFRAGFMKYMRSHAFCCGSLLAIDGPACCAPCRREVQNLRWITPHIMRHTFASLLVSAGESIYKVAVWMGDEVGTVQKHYGHLAPDHGGIEKAFSQRHAASFSDASGNSPLVNRSHA